MDGGKAEGMYGRTKRWTNGWKDISMDGCTDGQMDGWTDELNKAGYTAPDAPSTRLKITRDRRTEGRTEGHTLL